MSNDDSMRFHLVTKFACAKCGGQLALSYNAPRNSRFDRCEPDGISGAFKAEERIAIHPCEKCYGDAVKPLEALRQALLGLTKEERGN